MMEDEDDKWGRNECEGVLVSADEVGRKQMVRGRRCWCCWRGDMEGRTRNAGDAEVGPDEKDEWDSLARPAGPFSVLCQVLAKAGKWALLGRGNKHDPAAGGKNVC